MIKKIKTNHKLLIKIELFILITVAILGTAKVAVSVPSIKEAIVLATTKIPETFTELYFENHINLPVKIKQNQKYTFTFTIHNLENKDMDYPYTVYLQRDNQKIVIFKDTVYVKNNGFVSIEKTIGPLKNLRSKIVVELTNKNQIISFWMEKL